MEINRNEFVTAVSFALDFLEIGLHKTITNHGKRVALLSVYIGKELQLQDTDIFDLYAYATLHDNGMTHQAYNALSENGRDVYEGNISHCIVGERNIATFPFLKKRENVLLYHHEFFDGKGFYGVKGQEIPLFSRIIALTDMAEVYYSEGDNLEQLIWKLQKGSGKNYDPELTEALIHTLKVPAHWCSLNNMFIADEIQKLVPTYDVKISLDELMTISEIMRQIIDSKSPFTGRHSKGLAEKAAVMADFYEFDRIRKQKLIIAADMHDVGKLVVPNSIIDKPGKLNQEEFEIIKTHTYYTRKVLEKVQGLEEITEWASNHHEKLNGLGYPYQLSEKDLSFESQLMACLDIFQALTEERPYRKPMDQSEVEILMKELGEKGDINAVVVRDIFKAMGA